MPTQVVLLVTRSARFSRWKDSTTMVGTGQTSVPSTPAAHGASRRYGSALPCGRRRLPAARLVAGRAAVGSSTAVTGQAPVPRICPIRVSASFVAVATDFWPLAIACSMSCITLALSTSDQWVEVGVNQLRVAAFSSTAVVPDTADDRAVVLGSRPAWPSL